MKVFELFFLLLGVVSCSIFASFAGFMTIQLLFIDSYMRAIIIYSITIPAFIFWTICAFNAWRLVR